MIPLSTVLTPREWEVIGLLAQGCHQADVAEKLVISHGTVHAHASHIRMKLGAANTAHAVYLVLNQPTSCG